MIPIQSTLWRLAALTALLCLAADGSGAAADKKTPPASKAAPKQVYIFYPPAPAPPRVQYLTSYTKESDLGGGPTKFVKFLMGEEPAEMTIAKPHGIALHKGRIFVCDTSARSIAILDLKKKTMEIVAPEGEGQLSSPINIAIDADGTRYVTDSVRGQVVCYGKDNAYLGAIGETNLARPTGVAIMKERLYVTDIKNPCVRVYDKGSRKPLFTIPNEASGTNQLVAPVGLAVDSQGRIYASEMTLGRVQVYDADGKHLRTVGQMGDRPGDFARPKGVAVDRENRLYVVDGATYVVQIFDGEGRLLMYFGTPKSGAGALELPAGIAIDYDHVSHFQKYAAPDFVVEHVVLVTSQLGDRKVNVYGFGHKK
jgi:sugar lactone lactonase YvrE